MSVNHSARADSIIQVYTLGKNCKMSEYKGICNICKEGILIINYFLFLYIFFIYLFFISFILEKSGQAGFSAGQVE